MSVVPEVLVIGGDIELREAVRLACGPLGIAVTEVDGLTAGLRAVEESQYGVVVLSLTSTGAEIELVRRLAAAEVVGTLLVASERGSPGLAMEVVRAGAVDLLTLPYDTASLVQVLSRAREAEAAGDDVELEEATADLVGGSPALLDVFKAIGRVGPSEATVLVTGESGTGKELVAAALHRSSERSRGPFVAVNCAAIPEDLLESELFGHERGAFTGAVARKIGRFERAQIGTLFLDEIGDMSLVLQAKILRALQERQIERLGGEEKIPVDVRIVAATHRDLRAAMEGGEFREDLYYRLAVVRLHLPPLRERGADVEALALHYASRFAAHYGRPLRRVSGHALDLLRAHPWPGNVRELRNAMERAVLLSTGETILPQHLELEAGHGRRTPRSGSALPGYDSSLSMARVEALHIEQVLNSVGRHYGQAAEILGMHRNTVSRKAQEYGIMAEEGG
jgi:DNA-binding NtrC family response regulator